MTTGKGGTAGTDQSNSNARSRDPDRVSTTINRQADAALKFAGTSVGLSILASVAAAVGGLLLSRSQRLRSAVADAGERISDQAAEFGDTAYGAVGQAVGSVRDKLNERAAQNEADGSLDQMLDTIEVAPRQ